ncbi:histidyl-tRNA synthetase [Pullulanibacillus pueri]|uniref:Histidine--tRNA ligase n=1 Tax=Pullulanibacillus pueri TaxID=1437324 RepID=A0A8J2ZYB4_9BACL|nr:histidine--tRNA ligase [Pullulanibacillus pueri]MBM7683257.1 histidyl-tRNA synthetase [Pullulanibacillus pueri]GGH85753.1 histidine--tRNA ligase 2 [Pullulanibacillus pueri]
MAIKIPRGTQDILPDASPTWQWITEKARKICQLYRYEEIKTPMFESTDLFHRGVGETTDIVQKEMYTFKDRGDRSLTLRPEGTAPVVRSYVENKMHGWANQPVKLYYIGEMFRYERPQAGRTRQLTQFGVEAIGSDDPSLDAEVISLAMAFYKSFGLNKLKLVINSLGDLESRKAHREALIRHFEPSIHEFCSDCQNRLQKNPLRILDCKVDSEHPLMATAPSILDFLNETSKQHFEHVKEALDAMGIPYEVDATLVRGLDYYNHTTFEIMGADFGAITTLCGGGRYGGLVSELGGPEVSGIGFALSYERLLLALNAEQVQPEIENPLDCFIVAIGEAAEKKATELLYLLRQQGITADKDYMKRKTKGQFKQADRFGATTVAVLGDEELEKAIINVKNMETGEQQEVAINEFPQYVQKLVENRRDSHE